MDARDNHTTPFSEQQAQDNLPEPEIPLNAPLSESLADQPSRRRFLRWFGVSASGVTLASTLTASKEKIEEGGERAQEEIARLKKAYQELDDRSRLILKLILILSGLDFITAL